MDFSVIRRRPPPKMHEPPPPKPPPPTDPAPAPPPPPAPAPPPPPLYLEDLDHVSRMQRLRSIEYTNSRTWRMNVGDYPNGYYGHHRNYEHAHYPFGGAPGGYGNWYMMSAPPPRMALPPLDHYHALPTPPQRLALPPPDHHHGPSGLLPHPGNFYYPPPRPYGGGVFYDENPNECRFM